MICIYKREFLGEKHIKGWAKRKRGIKKRVGQK
jgi:hypothetical protein